MKKLRFLLAVVLCGIFLPALGNTAPSHLAASLANQTAAIAHTTLAMAQDSAITTYIYAKLASHPNLSHTNLDISTTARKVTLNGIVSNESQAQEIKQLAENTAGVKAVDASQIMVSQQESGFFIKPKSKTPEPTPQALAPAKIDQTLKEARSTLPASDPILTLPADQLAKTLKTAFKAKKPMKLVAKRRLKTHHSHKKHLVQHLKKKPSFAAKTKKHRSRFLAHSKKRATRHKQPLLHAQRPAPKTHRRLAQTKHPHEKQKKIQAARQQNNKESIGQMTNQFLKTALIANKPIPEE